DVTEPARGDEVLDIPPVPGPFGHDDFRRSFALAQLDHRGDDVRVGVDDLVAMVLDEVRLEDDPFALEGHLRTESLILPLDRIGAVGVVVPDGSDVDSGFRIGLPEGAHGEDGDTLDRRADPFAEAPFLLWCRRRLRYRMCDGFRGECKRIALLDVER